MKYGRTENKFLDAIKGNMTPNKTIDKKGFLLKPKDQEKCKISEFL